MIPILVGRTALALGGEINAQEVKGHLSFPRADAIQECLAEVEAAGHKVLDLTSVTMRLQLGVPQSHVYPASKDRFHFLPYVYNEISNLIIQRFVCDPL